jgi:RNA polymerase sigma factor (sigma-70 family)
MCDSRCVLEAGCTVKISRRRKQKSAKRAGRARVTAVSTKRKRALSDPMAERVYREQQVPIARSGPPANVRPLTEEQRLLAVRNLPLARALARLVEEDCPITDRDDLRSTAYEALVEAARTFDPRRGIPFGAFARRRILGNLRRFQRLLYCAGWRVDKATQSPAVALDVHDEGSVRVVGIRPDPPVGQLLEETEAIEAWLRKLPRPHATACRLLYLHGKSPSEAAALVGCSQSFFSRLHHQAIHWLLDEHEREQSRLDQLAQG